jgi:hypothetical protein
VYRDRFVGVFVPFFVRHSRLNLVLELAL